MSSKLFRQDKNNPVRTLTIPSNNAKGSIDVRVTEINLSADNLPLETWASSWVMASQLHRLSIPAPSTPTPTSSSSSSSSTSPIPILELGAGTGLVGVTAACVWNTHVILTDLEPIVPGLAANISLNTELLHSHSGSGSSSSSSSSSSASASCGTLDWTTPTTLIQESGTQIPSSTKARIILAADTVYSEEHPSLLSNVVLEWLERSEDARFVVTYAMRVAYLDEIRLLWELLERGGLVAVEEGQDRAGDDMFDDECLCEWSVWKWKTVAEDGVVV